MLLIVAASLLGDALLAWLLLRRSAPDVPHLLFAGACGLMVVALEGAVAAVLLHRGFLAIRLVHAWLFLFLPAAGVAVLLAARRRGATRGARWMAGCGAVVLPALFAWTSLVEPFELRLERADVPLRAAHAPGPPLSIGVLADLQCEEVGAHEREAIETLMAQHPDLILIPGDLFQVFSRADAEALAPPLRALLGQLDAPLGVYAVCGNCDGREVLEPMLRGTHVRLLCDECVHLHAGERTIALCGLRLMVMSDPSHRALAELEAEGGDELRIVLAHLPDAALQLPPSTRVDLVVAGHTHGGQVHVPWFGPLVTLSNVPREVAAGGLHRLNGTQLYVSRGVGVERGDAPRIRFDCPPEVSLLRLCGTLAVP